MMTEENIAINETAVQDSVCFAELDGNVVVIRITGRGTFANSVELKQLSDHISARGKNTQLIIDLDKCTTMDSTFMGVLASVGLRQSKNTGHQMPIVNANPQNLRLMQTLGLSHFMNVRAAGAEAPRVDESDFQSAPAAEISRTERVIHMIEAHENLCQMDAENSVRFESVLKYLNESLQKGS